MRAVFSRCVAMLALATVVGCASMLPRERVTVQYVDQLITAEKYGVALDVLAAVPEAHPEYPTLREKLREVRIRAATYERTVLSRAQRKMADGNWAGALRDVEIGLDKFPSSVALTRGREGILRKQAQRVQELKTEMLIAEGKWLAEDAPLREELARVNPKSLSSKWGLWRTRKAREGTAQKLYNCGEQAMGENRLELAEKCLSLAERLDPSVSIKTDVVRLRREIAQREEEVQRERQRAQEERLRQRVTRLEELVKEAMQRDELPIARRILAELSAMDPGNPEARRLHQQLNRTVSARVAPMLERSALLYREGKIEEAKKIWEEVLRLDPSHGQAQAGVERANRVLDNLRRLKERDAPAK